jgi:hypothetical protein
MLQAIVTLIAKINTGLKPSPASPGRGFRVLWGNESHLEFEEIIYILFGGIKVFEGLVLEWKTVGLFLLVIIYNIILIYARRRGAKNKYLSDMDMLYNIAREKSCSEYDIFVMAAEAWRFSKYKIENDFREYLRSQHIPHYVKDFVRKMTFQPEAA